MRIEGYCCTVGELDAEDVRPMLGVPSLQFQMADGRIVTLTGLTRDECREGSKIGFGSNVTLTLAKA